MCRPGGADGILCGGCPRFPAAVILTPTMGDRRRERSAAIVVIGNEILTGKSQDKNANYLIGELYRLGVALRRIEIIPDDLDEIAKAVRECAAKFDYVFTSGGIGPTHDDVTIQGIALAFNREVVRNP